jgi:hypothetical protein
MPFQDPNLYAWLHLRKNNITKCWSYRNNNVTNLGMTPKQFKDWMSKEKLKVRDISYFTKLHSNTIYAYLRDEAVTDSTRDALEKFRLSYPHKREATAS